jgi:hypothetical protein
MDSFNLIEYTISRNSQFVKKTQQKIPSIFIDSKLKKYDMEFCLSVLNRP